MSEEVRDEKDEDELYSGKRASVGVGTTESGRDTGANEVGICGFEVAAYWLADEKDASEVDDTEDDGEGDRGECEDPVLVVTTG